MKLLVEIEGNAEILVADIDARDRRAFELSGYKDIGAPLMTALKDVAASKPETYTGWLAWHALKRAKTTSLSWREFEAILISTTAEEIEEDSPLGNPTELKT